MLRVLLVPVAAGAGAFVGVVATVQSRAYVGPWPLGLPAALLLSALVVAVPGALAGSRWPAVAAALGWLAVFVVLTLPRQEGDVVVANDALGYGWLLGPLVVGGAALPRYGRRRRPPRE